MNLAKKFSFLILFFLTALNLFSQVKVGFLSDQKKFRSNSEQDSAFYYLRNEKSFTVREITFKEVSDSPEILNNFNVIWFLKPDTLSFSPDETKKDVISSINNFVKNGGGLLLTLDAFNYINTLSLETEKPLVKYFKAEPASSLSVSLMFR